MVELTEKELQAIHETHDAVIRLETIIGNGEQGLYVEVRNHGKRITRIEIILAALVGSGVLGTASFQIVKLLGE